MLYYRSGTGYTVVAMEELAENEYEAVFPAFDCGSLVEYYFSVEIEGGKTIYNPSSAPDRVHARSAYTGIATTFIDDFETDQGWTVNDTEDLTDGTWERGVPQGGPNAPSEDADGSGQCYVTKLEKGRDVDGWYTELYSPAMDATDPNSVLAFSTWFASHAGDFLIVEARDTEGQRWNRLINIAGGNPGWVNRTYKVGDIPNIDNTDQFQLRFRVRDNSPDSTCEAGIDAVEIRGALICEQGCPADFDGSGDVGFTDIIALLAVWGPCEDCPEDLDGNGDVGFNDLIVLLAAWGPCG